MKNETAGTLAILLATVFWGMTFAFIKDAVESTSIFNFLFWRFGMATLLMGLLFYKHLTLSKVLIPQGTYLGLLLAGTVVFQTIGLQYTQASTASFIMGLAVLFVPLSLYTYQKKWPPFNVIFAVVLALIGIVFISFRSGLEFNIGNVWVLLSAFCFTAYIILAGKYSQNGHSLSLVFIQFFTIFVIVAMANWFTGTLSVPTEMNVWVAVIFCAVFASVISCYLQLRFQRYITATKTAIIFSCEPIFATITAVIYVHEVVDFQFMVGASLVLAAILISELKSKKPVQIQD
jgi:drug/metabolite transporter (DMT)-like permease